MQVLLLFFRRPPLNICASDSSTLLYPEKFAKIPQVTCLILDISHLSEMLGDCRTNQGTEERMFVFHPFSFVRGGEDAAAKGSSGSEGKGKINNCFSFGRWGIERRGIPKKKKKAFLLRNLPHLLCRRSYVHPKGGGLWLSICNARGMLTNDSRAQTCERRDPAERPPLDAFFDDFLFSFCAYAAAAAAFFPPWKEGEAAFKKEEDEKSSFYCSSELAAAAAEYRTRKQK